MSGSLGDLLNELTAAVLEPFADVLIGELFTNVFVVVFVVTRVTGDADHDTNEMVHTGKGLCDWLFKKSRAKRA